MEDYKKRFINEFSELKERTSKLDRIIRKAEQGKLDFELSCPLALLKQQYKAMSKYLDILKTRAVIEEIDMEF